MGEAVDILLATYNGEKYIREQIYSILNQTYRNFRLIISDDNSTDNTLSIINEYAKIDNRIIVFEQEKNLGSTANFEFLLKKVTCRYYMLSDQDDIWLPDKVEKSLQKLIQTQSDLVFTDLEVVNKDLKIVNKSFWKLKGFSKKIRKHCNFEGLYLNNFITGCTIISKKDFIDKILPLPKNSKYLIHDYWISLVVSRYGKISYLNRTYVLYRQHENNQLGSKRHSDSIKKLKQIRDLFVDVKIDHFKVFIEKENLFDEKTKKINKQAIEYFEKLQKIKYANFNIKDWVLFFKLYKYEKFTYIMLNFIILNFPVITKI